MPLSMAATRNCGVAWVAAVLSAPDAASAPAGGVGMRSAMVVAVATAATTAGVAPADADDAAAAVVAASVDAFCTAAGGSATGVGTNQSSNTDVCAASGAAVSRAFVAASCVAAALALPAGDQADITANGSARSVEVTAGANGSADASNGDGMGAATTEDDDVPVPALPPASMPLARVGNRAASAGAPVATAVLGQAAAAAFGTDAEAYDASTSMLTVSGMPAFGRGRARPVVPTTALVGAYDAGIDATRAA